MKTLALLAAACLAAPHALAAGTSFGSDLDFLNHYVGTFVLSDRSGAARVAVIPAYEGRVMTSTAGGNAGRSFGWINRELIASGKFIPHFNPLGGEDRFWLGPEGGQYGLFFKKGAPFDLAHWYTPAPFDTQPFALVTHGRDRAMFRKTMHLANYAGARFDLRVDREVRVLQTADAWHDLGIAPVPGVKAVAYETDNRITNVGRSPWRQNTGLLSIWILGQFTPGPQTTIVLPIRRTAGKVVNDTYFGKVPSDRLKIEDGVAFFSGDGRYRSKIGIAPAGAKPIAGSYDAAGHVLTLVQYTLPSHASGYVNSMWEIQKSPYGGDVVNSYNDGPPAPGKKPLGPFYEIETSSPAAALAPGQSASHMHRTMHFQGSEGALDRIARAALGVSIARIKSALPTPSTHG